MLLVPLLVGVAILTVAVMSRVEAREELHPPGLEIVIESETASARSPIADAFPHLQLWIPRDELIHAARCGANNGRSGPDIVIRSPLERLTEAA